LCDPSRGAGCRSLVDLFVLFSLSVFLPLLLLSAFLLLLRLFFGVVIFSSRPDYYDRFA